MNEQHNQTSEGTDLAKGLPMFTAADPQALAEEKAQLAVLQQKGILKRWRWYFSKTGPGWMQSAMTLGGGSAMASLYLGAHYKFDLLWVQPLAMAVGIIMLMVASHQTLSTGIRPFDAMRRFVHPALAWAWVIATLISTIIWHLPQYALSAGIIEDIMNALTGLKLSGSNRTLLLLAIGVIVLLVSTLITWSYGKGGRSLRIYEKALKFLVWGIIVAFAIVVIRTAVAGKIDWAGLFKGFLPLHLPTDARGVEKVMAAFGAAVGINMTFLFGYTLLARGWSREHRGLARFDLITGMLLPYSIAVSLMVIAAGCTIHGAGLDPSAAIVPAKAGMLIAETGVGPFFGRIIFGLGILGMALSTITLHMLVVGFSACEVFGIEPGGWKYRLSCLIPAPSFLGVVLWKYMGTWVAIPTSAIAGLLLPIAYVGWFILNNSTRYLGEDKPTGKKAMWCNIAMLISIVVATSAAVYYLYSKQAFFAKLFGL